MSRRRLALVALCALVVIVGGWLLLRSHSSEPAPTAASGASEPTCPIATLPREVGDTVKHIHAGGPFLFPRSDGAVFINREGHLPKQRSGYYHEYTVITPRSRDRSMRRIVTGRNTIDRSDPDISTPETTTTRSAWSPALEGNDDKRAGREACRSIYRVDGRKIRSANDFYREIGCLC